MAAPLLTRSQLQRPARFAARSVGQAYLQRVREEAGRVEVLGNAPPGSRQGEGLGELQADPEAVHDFRIAVRRLRTWLRCWRRFLRDTVEQGSERRLQRISRSAGRTRDLEVARGWLQDQALRRTLPAREAANWLAERVAGQHRRALRQLARQLATELPAVAAVADRELRNSRLVVDTGRQETPLRMDLAMARLLQKHADRFGRALGRVRHAGQVDAAHRARIAVKRLRYLLDVLEPQSRPAGAAIKRLARFQGLLGDLHDLHLLADQLSRRQSVRGATLVPPGLPALGAALRRRTTAQFREVHRSIRAGEVMKVIDAVERITRKLRKESRR